MNLPDRTDGRRRPSFPFPVVLALVAGMGLAGSRGWAESPPTPAECETRFAADPEAETSAYCFQDAGRDRARKAEAVSRMEALLQLHPGNAWLHYYLGGLLWDEPAPSADQYAAAADLLKQSGNAFGEVRACASRYQQLIRLDRRQEAAAMVTRAREVAEASGDRLAVIRARLLEAASLMNRSEDLPRAYQLLLEVRESLLPADSSSLWKDCLTYLADLAMSLSRLDDAERFAREAIDRAVADGNVYAESIARYNLLRAVREEMYLLPNPGDRQQVLQLAQQTLDAAASSGYRKIEGKAHGILGLLTSAPESELHFERCYELAEVDRDRSFCRSQQARRLAAEDPQRARQLLDEALDLAEEADAPEAATFAWRERMRVSWLLGTPGQAAAESVTALQSIELLRDLQAPTEGRAEIFAYWASHYHWLAGRLLQEAVTGDSQSLSTAFTVQERMRARALIDSLRAAGASSTPETDFAALGQVRQALAPDEALLSFQIAPWADMVGDFAGGAWLTVVTRDGATVHPLRSPLAERTRLRPAVEVFSGLFTGDGDGGDAAAALYRALLADGLSGLGPGIRRLVIVPDDVLHLLPFSALRTDPGAAPLATRYEITVTPSATLWLRWRQAPAVPGASALVLADPASAPLVAPASVRAASFVSPAGLGALPWARQEGEAVLRHLGAGSRLLVGSEATEAYLKKGPVPYGILHFATHAWTSDNEPDHSFVRLAPGAPGEDGMLHPSEIVRLPLRGRLVVLSACSSASGEILRGEGVMGLARAFFQAGATTVVATLWPLRDDDGADLFERFYDHLGEGMSVAAALQAAQRDRMAAGAPPSAWAGAIVLGDGGRVPLPGGHPRVPSRFVVSLILTLILTLSALSVLLLLARRRRRVHA